MAQEQNMVIYENISEYVSHLKSIYELEMFYGDETLGSLLDHGKQIMEELEGVETIFDPPDNPVQIEERGADFETEKKKEKE